MKSFINHSFKFILPVLFVLTVITAQAQDARLKFEKLNKLETKAQDVVEVNIDGKMLDLAKRALVKVNDADAKKSVRQSAV